jgi:aspartyl-tRNA(Asn)/glutamyl-tRNA(Gln) amidotransferase subunit A
MNLTLNQTLKAIAAGELSSLEVLESTFRNIDRYEPKVKAYLWQEDREVLREQARTFDSQRKARTAAPPGIPIAIKDNIAVQAQPLTAASKVLEGFISPYDATVIQKLKDAGYLCLGKANLDEWAFGSSTEHSAYHVTRNPLDLERVPGGSSGGSGAAVCYGGALAALGSDTGGSIRLPAAFCGIYALKPTYGSVSRFGLIAFGSSLDQIGPMTRSLEDLPILLKLIQGRDPMDPTSRDVSFGEWNGSSEIRVGIPQDQERFLSGCDAVVTRSYWDFLKFAESQPGVKLVPLDLKPLAFALPLYYIIAPAEASSNLSRFDGVRYGKRVNQETLEDIYYRTRAQMGDEAKLRILVGTFCLSAGYQEAYYGRATHLRNQLRHWFIDQFRSCDVVVIPTSPTVAFKMGERLHDPIAMYASDTYTVGVNLTGVPALSCPHYTSESHLPVGIQFVGNHGSDYALCGIAERFSEFFQFKPPSSGERV